MHRPFADWAEHIGPSAERLAADYPNPSMILPALTHFTARLKKHHEDRVPYHLAMAIERQAAES